MLNLLYNNTTFFSFAKKISINLIRMSKIGKNIRKIRATKGLSQTAFANLFNITRASIGAYEEGRAEPKTDIMLQIAKYFSIPVESLLSEELTVNKLTNFNLKSVLSKKNISNEKTILFINKWNWSHFLDETRSNDEFTISFSESFLQGEIAIEVNSQIETNFPIGTIIMCSPSSNPTKEGLYLVVLDDKTMILNFSETKRVTKQAKKLFIINQKVESVLVSNDSDLENRLERIESQMIELTRKLKK
jgi:transcriptional regulator with XRE-family HTH domain